MNGYRLRLFCCLFLASILFHSPLVWSEDDEGIGESLRTDVILPKFDRLPMVARPNVVFSQRWEIGFFGSAQFTEPVYQPLRFGLEAGYHFKEEHSFHGSVAFWLPGLNNQYVPGIEAQGPPYDFSRAPSPKLSLWGFYHLKAYYGKISIAKKKILNLSLYSQFGLGATQFPHKTYPGLSIGVGQRFYFNGNFAVKAEVKLQYLGMVNPFLPEKLKVNQPEPSYNKFRDIYRFATLFEVGVLWLF